MVVSPKIWEWFLEIPLWWWINYQTFHGGGQRYTSPEIEQGVPKSTTWNIFFSQKMMPVLDTFCWISTLNNSFVGGVHFSESKKCTHTHPTKLTLRHWKNGSKFPILSLLKIVAFEKGRSLLSSRRWFPFHSLVHLLSFHRFTMASCQKLGVFCVVISRGKCLVNFSMMSCVHSCSFLWW